MSAGKGDKYRPVKKAVFDNNFDEINWVTKDNKEIRNYKVKKSKKIYKYPWRTTFFPLLYGYAL